MALCMTMDDFSDLDETYEFLQKFGTLVDYDNKAHLKLEKRIVLFYEGYRRICFECKQVPGKVVTKFPIYRHTENYTSDFDCFVLELQKAFPKESLLQAGKVFRLLCQGEIISKLSHVEINSFLAFRNPKLFYTYNTSEPSFSIGPKEVAVWELPNINNDGVRNFVNTKPMSVTNLPSVSRESNQKTLNQNWIDSDSVSISSKSDRKSPSAASTPARKNNVKPSTKKNYVKQRSITSTRAKEKENNCKGGEKVVELHSTQSTSGFRASSSSTSRNVCRTKKLVKEKSDVTTTGSNNHVPNFLRCCVSVENTIPSLHTLHHLRNDCYKMNIPSNFSCCNFQNFRSCQQVHHCECLDQNHCVMQQNSCMKNWKSCRCKDDQTPYGVSHCNGHSCFHKPCFRSLHNYCCSHIHHMPKSNFEQRSGCSHSHELKPESCSRIVNGLEENHSQMDQFSLCKNNISIGNKYCNNRENGLIEIQFTDDKLDALQKKNESYLDSISTKFNSKIKHKLVRGNEISIHSPINNKKKRKLFYIDPNASDALIKNNTSKNKNDPLTTNISSEVLKKCQNVSNTSSSNISSISESESETIERRKLTEANRINSDNGRISENCYLTSDSDYSVNKFRKRKSSRRKINRNKQCSQKSSQNKDLPEIRNERDRLSTECTSENTTVSETETSHLVDKSVDNLKEVQKVNSVQHSEGENTTDESNQNIENSLSVEETLVEENVTQEISKTSLETENVNMQFASNQTLNLESNGHSSTTTIDINETTEVDCNIAVEQSQDREEGVISSQASEFQEVIKTLSEQSLNSFKQLFSLHNSCSIQVSNEYNDSNNIYCFPEVEIYFQSEENREIITIKLRRFNNQTAQLRTLLIEIFPDLNNLHPLAIVKGVCRSGCKHSFYVEKISSKIVRKSKCKSCNLFTHYACPNCTQEKGGQKLLCLMFSFYIYVLYGRNVLSISVDGCNAERFLGCTLHHYLAYSSLSSNIILKLSKVRVESPPEDWSDVTLLQLNVKSVRRSNGDMVLKLVNTSFDDCLIRNRCFISVKEL